MRTSSLRDQRAGAIFLGTVFLAVLIFSANKVFFIGRYEVVALRLYPSAERAYTYGTWHFNAQDPAMYDIQKAEFFFNQAAALDPKIPYLQHQLGRIAFLKSDFGVALIRMNRELNENPEPSPSSYYMRGLIEGYMGDYVAAANDYEKYLESDPTNW